MEVETNDLVFYLIFLLIIFFLSVCYFFVYSGLFAPVEIRAQRPPFGSLRVAYKFARGPYKNAGHLFTEAHSLVPELKTIGIYYDDPQQVLPSYKTYRNFIPLFVCCFVFFKNCLLANITFVVYSLY